MNQERFLRRLRAAAQAADLVGLHLSADENGLLHEFDDTLDKRQEALEEGYGRELNPVEETLLIEQTFNDLPGSREAFERRTSLTTALEKKLGQKKS